MRRKKYRYFISYAVAYNGMQGFGNYEYVCNYKIQDIDDLREIGLDLEERLDLPSHSLCILNYKRL